MTTPNQNWTKLNKLFDDNFPNLYEFNRFGKNESYTSCEKLVKLFIYQLLEEAIQEERDRLVREIEGYIKYTPEQVREMNKDLGNRIEDELYFKSLGMIKAKDDIINLIKK